MITRQNSIASFDALRGADLQEVYEGAKQEALREYAFLASLDQANNRENLKNLIFNEPAGLDRWTAGELLELSNRFRLLDAPECEIRLYESGSAEFRAIPRAREFYLLALNKVGRISDVIDECRQLIALDGGNGLVWGILGDSYSIKMLSAERFLSALDHAEGNMALVDGDEQAEFRRQFPDQDFRKVTLDGVRSLRKQFLCAASEAYRLGFERSGTAFTGLCWMIRTIDQRVDLLAERAYLQRRLETGMLDEETEASLRRVNERFAAVELSLSVQPVLIDIALEMGGGAESLDFWTHSGKLQLASSKGCSIEEISSILARAFATLDAEYKLLIFIKDLTRIRDQYGRMVDIARTRAEQTDHLERVLETTRTVLDELEAGRIRFVAGGKKRGSTLDGYYRKIAEAPPAQPEVLFLKHTFNFRPLTNNLVPQYIKGGIGRTGARVPDLTINRQVQEDLRALIIDTIVPALPEEERTLPKTVISAIQRLVGERLGLAELQDLQSPAHHAFDARSSGLILLAGIDPAMRLGSRSTTDLTVAMLLHTGDCRETMYLNGALFASYQHLRVGEKLREAMDCLAQGDTEAIRRICAKEIPALLRYQLRGGHVSIYVDGIAMQRKYYAERVSETDPLAIERRYDVEAFRSGQPLSSYELENAKLRVNYEDGATVMIEPRDAMTGTWRPIEHVPVPNGGGIPKISETGPGGGAITDIRLLNLVEEHSMSFLYDSETGDIELCDGFYNESLFDSPYRFGCGRLEPSDMIVYGGLMRAGTREVRGTGGEIQNHQVYIEFMPYSTTDYTPSLGEADLPNAFQIMGRLYAGSLSEERRKLEDGFSSIPAVLEKLSAWQLQQGTTVVKPEALEGRFVRLLIELARDRPELVSLQDVTHATPLLTQGIECDGVYLVLSGRFHTYQDEKVVIKDGRPMVAAPGTILGEISTLLTCMPTATVMGDGTVLRIARSEFQRQLEINPAFRENIKELAETRLTRDRDRRAT